ncbi:MAG: hypothetical protein JXA41_02370 [Deltaproteobacteria bacterium]|nr:hypothetical protein [Deltaproteobacteria bacterium]
MNSLKKIMKGHIVGLILLCLFASAPTVWATYELSQSDIKANAPINKLTQWTDDLTVSWEAPTMGSGDILNGFIYKWSSSATALSDDDFNIDTGNDGFTSTEPYAVIKNKTDLENLDSGDLLYLHIKTFYLAGGSQQTYSTDVVVGPFMIDNVAPTGSVRIVDENDNDITETSNSMLNLKLAASADSSKIYISEALPRPETGYDFVTDMTWDLTEATPGEKTIYAWFEDSVGNVSSSPVTDTVTLLSSVHISPYTATIDLVSNSTQVFVVEGTSATYDWSIINEVPETSGTVAQFSGNSTGVNSVTVEGLVKGTFQLQAVGGGQTLTSGTITVTESTSTYDIPLAVGWNLISIPVQPVDTAIATILSGISGKYSIVWGEFNPSTSAWKSYNPTKPINTLTAIGPNKGYWINVTEDCVLSVTGNAASKAVDLLTGWNLIGFSGDADTAITTVLASISGKYSIVWGEFNPSTSSWKSYNPTKPINTLTTMGVGKGYWINATENSTLSY